MAAQLVKVEISSIDMSGTPSVTFRTYHNVPLVGWVLDVEQGGVEIADFAVTLEDQLNITYPDNAGLP